MNLEALLRDQNPHWFDKKYSPPEVIWFKRDYYQVIVNSLSQDLIVSLTGLRRVGKSTLLKQVLGLLLNKVPSSNILYFSFDQSVIKNEAEILRQILNTYQRMVLQRPFNTTDKPIYVFLDEIQIIPYWQDVLKTYYDTMKNIKFIISGSASLFVHRRSTESLAGRIREIKIPPLSFNEYLLLNERSKEDIDKTGIDKYMQFFPDFLSAYFEKYLHIGQFPQIVKNDYSDDLAQDYLQTIIDKILDVDLPRIYPIKRPDILKVIFAYLREFSGSLLNYDNLTNDLGVDIRTTVKYIDWMQKSFLVELVHNQTKKFVKSARTSKKVYLTSTNLALNLSLGSKVETYIYNFLKSFHLTIEFYRFQTQEIDFITTGNKGMKIPWEVKYRETIGKNDYKHLLGFAQRNKSPYAFLITKNTQKAPEKIEDTWLHQIPASKIELIDRKKLWEKII